MNSIFLLKMLSTSYSSSTGEEKWLNGQYMDKFYPIEELYQRIRLGPTTGLSDEEDLAINMLGLAVDNKKKGLPFDHISQESIQI